MTEEHLNSDECNVLFVGQTGVGKSSLINCILGKEKADVGVGKPVTKRRKWYDYDSRISYLKIKLYDTWGIEPDKEQEWCKYIEGIIGESDEDAEAVFDYAIYCISAGSKRIQKSDIKIIKKFKDRRIKTIVVLTKCDLAVPSQREKLRELLLKDIAKDIVVIETSSGGDTWIGKTEPFGWQTLLSRLFVGRLASLMQHWIPKIVGEGNGDKCVDEMQVTLRMMDSVLSGCTTKSKGLCRTKKK